MKNKLKKIERVQTGVRVEKRVLKVLKAIAAHHEISLSDLMEGIFLHALEGKSAFGTETLELIKTLRPAYKLDLTAQDSHCLTED